MQVMRKRKKTCTRKCCCSRGKHGHLSGVRPSSAPGCTGSALNTIFTQKRKPSKIEYRESLETVSPAVKNLSEASHDVQRLHRAIRLLAETDRAIISMHLDGYDNAETAEVLGISNNHAAVKLHRIKQQLANILKP